MTSIIIPLFIILILITGIFERKNVYELFIQGVKDGIKLSYNIFPYIFAITILSGLLSNLAENNEKFDDEFGKIISLCIVKPLSGGASTEIVVDTFKKYGPDSRVGIIASLLMASTETTLYVISIVSSKIKVKKMSIVIICGLMADLMSMILAIIFSKYLLY